MFASVVRCARSLAQHSEAELLGGARVLSGHNVPKSYHKTLRKWYPNIHRKHLFSETLNRKVTLSVTARVLRTIDKYGSLDAYLLGVKDTLLSSEAMRLRLKIFDAKHGRVDPNL
ncbi:hypothetical protein DL93DRAFT_2049398 [Clavulina sp. PMI_390]|nr:hypothetical protein DL93DRAFT_2049398 [Clavulina sp. PMI_390]